MDHTLIFHGLSMDDPWNIHEPSMDDPWIVNGFSASPFLFFFCVQAQAAQAALVAMVSHVD